MARTDVSRRTFLAALPALATTLAAARPAWAREPVGAAGSAAGGPGASSDGAAGPAGSRLQLPVPDWMQVDRDARQVSLEVVAGMTDANNNWNFNGFTNGEADIVVPEGFEVRLTFRNEDPNLAHSMGIVEVRDPWPAVFEDPQPAFDGAITSNPTSMTEATASGESEELAFTAATAGEYALVCFVPGHALTGMWTYFVVSGEGAAGVRDRG